jgi:hypothetical protein
MLIVEHFWSGVCKQTGADDFNPTKGLAPQPTGMRSLNARVREGCNKGSSSGVCAHHTSVAGLFCEDIHVFIFEHCAI